MGRYSATTVLALLQEVTHSAEVNMDWNALVRNTSTGISDAREYQMLWRHLAYHHTLLHKFDHGAQPLVSHSATFISFFFWYPSVQLYWNPECLCTHKICQKTSHPGRLLVAGEKRVVLSLACHNFFHNALFSQLSYTFS